MFTRQSRYATTTVAPVRTARGAVVLALRLPVRPHPGVRREHLRDDAQRPDLIAAHYLGDATAFWRLCDAGDAIAPDALANRRTIAIPDQGR